MSELRLADLNRVFMVGRLTKDPELRQTTNGTSVANFTIALNRRYKSATGEWKDEATYVGVVAWQKLAELCKQYLAKGRAVLVEGKLQNRNWETEDGQKRSIIEIRADRIEFLDRESRSAAATGATGSESGPDPVANEEPAISKSDDDLPF
ncbi:single-stranded DNA-binding protein [candidate division TA06 bacterium]|uniref:Single-stranded DNA-binding protein n=1 Tax=candidate division TA06 bacterium TaxID=2250710 RepID=A0A933IAG0_UNCT6|nr:single-stranded DNA-binding protein [candidate division TA06 bacterium]